MLHLLLNIRNAVTSVIYLLIISSSQWSFVPQPDSAHEPPFLMEPKQSRTSAYQPSVVPLSHTAADRANTE